ncbi:MAG: hypothetical protein ACREIV_04570, partial [Planctomycetaceae bacterium]
MKHSKTSLATRYHHERHGGHEQQRLKGRLRRRRPNRARPAFAYRQRGHVGSGPKECFNAPEVWHEPLDDGHIRFAIEPAGEGHRHPVTEAEVRERLAQLPARFTRMIEAVQFSRMTRKRSLFPCYGMQWGPNIYLYPLEESLVETYSAPPRPEQRIEARMYGGRWMQDGKLWKLIWTPGTVRDFYLNNVLIHEVGHVNDD